VKLNYKMNDARGGPVTNLDHQNKGAWCVHGETIENSFVETYGKRLSLQINPEKTTDKFALDLVNAKHIVLGDLKTQNTPFLNRINYMESIPNTLLPSIKRTPLGIGNTYIQKAIFLFIFGWIGYQSDGSLVTEKLK
jgi:hypothetical protein